MSAVYAPVRSPQARAPQVDPPSALRLRDVSKRFGHGASAVTALAHVDLEVCAGEFVCIVGASGCGKSTLLNLVAGLERPSAGSVAVSAGQPALLFQDAALFPWLTVAENIAFPLQMQGVSRRERQARAGELIRLVRLDGFADRRPHELSGGMRQRAALARALAQRASVLLMDEPFGALDAITRELLHGELERIWRDARLTVLFVTHDVGEALRLADRVVVLSSRPGTILAEYRVDAPRPRLQSAPDAAALAETIVGLLRSSRDEEQA
jgi:NitT/TauT family transport system ATP-binding protein